MAEVDRRVNALLKARGYGDHLLHRTGHSFGVTRHEAPFLADGYAREIQPGMLFSGLWTVCKPLMDPKTVAKVHFIRGDCSDGSANDRLLRQLIGPDWRKLCDRPKDDYSHDDFWPTVLALVAGAVLGWASFWGGEGLARLRRTPEPVAEPVAG